MDCKCDVTPQPKRIVIRAKDDLLNNYNDIVRAWFRPLGYTEDEGSRPWTDKHYVHLGGENRGHFHIIIDMEVAGNQSQSSEIVLHELYRWRSQQRQVRKKHLLSSNPIADGCSDFLFIDPKKQAQWYQFAQNLTGSFPWGHE